MRNVSGGRYFTGVKVFRGGVDGLSRIRAKYLCNSEFISELNQYVTVDFKAENCG